MFEWAGWVIGVGRKRTEWATVRELECRASEWNWVEKKNLSETESALAASLLIVCSFLIYLFIYLAGKREREKSTRWKISIGTARPSDRPKNSLGCCECQSKRSAQRGLPWVTLHRLVRTCETDNSLGGLSGLMTRFPGICVAAVLRPGSPSKELCCGAVLPPYCYRYQHYGGTGG